MAKKYNIALIPISEGDKIIKLSQNYSHLADTYLLGENSLPHLTLCQFFAEESDIARIWRDVCNALNDDLVALSLSKLSRNTIDEYDWIALLPDAHPDLIKMHYAVANIIKFPINRSFANYHPHITLINININKNKEKNYGTLIQNCQELKPIKDRFRVALGECDQIGQFTKLIWQREENEK